jgi:hypothetical protein
MFERRLKPIKRDDLAAGTLGGIGDVTITSIASGEILKWNGSAWINNTLAEAAIAGVDLANTFSATNTFEAASVRTGAAIILGDASSHAGIYLKTAAGTNEKNWGIEALSTALFRITSATDADGAGYTFFQADRATGSTNVDTIALNSTGTISLTATTEVSIGTGDFAINGGDLFVWDNTLADYMRITHDGTDIKFQHLNTTSWDIEDLSTMLLLDGGAFYIYDSTNTDYVRIQDNGSNTSITTNNNAIQMTAGNGLIQLLALSNGVRFYDSANLDYLSISHNGTNGVLQLPSGDGAFNLKTVAASAFTIDCNGGSTFPSVNAGSGTNVEHTGGIVSATNNDQVAWQVYVADGVQYGRCGIYVDDATNYLGLSYTYSTGYSGFRVIRAGAVDLELTAAGRPLFPNHTTTASAANAVLNSTTGQLDRSTSSARYKTNMRPIPEQAWKAVLSMNPIKYNSLAENDNPEWSYYGLTAEDVAAVDPRLVHWGPATPLEYKTERLEDDNGDPYLNHTLLPRDETLVPDGVMYERLAVMLLEVCKDQEKRIEQLENISNGNPATDNQPST